MDGYYGDPCGCSRYLITGPVQILDEGKTEIYCLTKNPDHNKVILVYKDKDAFIGNGFNIPFSWFIN